MRLSRRLYIWWYLARKIPLILWCNIRVVREDFDICHTVIKPCWRNRNPFGIIYFSALITAGEMAAGTLLLERVLKARDAGEPLVLVIKNTSAQFKRSCNDLITFKCSQGLQMDLVVEDAAKTDMHTSIETISEGYNRKGKLACTVKITWVLYLT